MPLYVPQHTPTWKQGYASCAAESRNPGLWKGLVFAGLPSLGPTGLTLRDVSGWERHGTLTGMDPATDWIVSPAGYGVAFSNTTSESVRTATALPLDDLTELSIVSTWRTGAAQASWDAVASQQLNGNSFGVLLGFASGTTLLMYVRTTGVNTQEDAVVTYSDSLTHTSALTWTAGSAKLYFDGRTLLENTDTTGAVNCGTGVGNPFLIGLGRTQPNYAFNGDVFSVAVYNRVLNPSEIQQLHQDPYALVRQRAMWLPSAGAVTPPTGNRRRRLLIGA
jgi:hypothetical protein